MIPKTFTQRGVPAADPGPTSGSSPESEWQGGSTRSVSSIHILVKGDRDEPKFTRHHVDIKFEVS